MATNYQPDPIDPEGYTTNAVPVGWLAAAQVRQFGVGGASTKATPPTVLTALANPPAAMATAAAKVLTKAAITTNDRGRYFSS